MSATPPPLPPRTSAGIGLLRGYMPHLVTLLPLLAVAGAAALAWLLAARWGVPPALAAALAAGLGVLVAAVPLAQRVRRALALNPVAGPAGSTQAAPPVNFLDRARREVARAHRHGGGAALLLVDVDRSAQHADAGSRATIDSSVQALLQKTAQTLRSTDLLARFASSKLLVLLSPADLTGALDVAERIRESAQHLEVPVAPGTRPWQLTVSVGVAMLQPAPADLAAMIADAGAALAVAWQAGGNCVRVGPTDAGRQAFAGPHDDHRA